MNGLRRTTLSAVLAGATALAGMALLPSVLPAAADPLRSAAAVTESPRLIVGYRQASSAARSDSAATDHLTRKRSTAKLQRRLATGAVLVDAGSGDIAALTSALRSDPDVAYVEPDQRMYAHAAPDDTEYNRQWHLFESAAGMNVPGAWATSTGSGVTVAVIDTGYVAHSDLAANIVAGYDFITSSSNARDGNGRDSNAATPVTGRPATSSAGSAATPSTTRPGTAPTWPARSPRSRTTARAWPASPTTPRSSPSGCWASAAATPPTSPTRSSGRPAAPSRACPPTRRRPR